MLNYLLQAIAAGASDLHVSPGVKPFMRIAGDLQPFGWPVTVREMEALLELTATQERHSPEDGQGVSIWVSGTRCRVQRYAASGSEHLAIRILPSIPAFEALGLPEQATALLQSFERGLVLISGPTGCGKSTTLAAWLARLNETASRHIITLEDPIEWLHESLRSKIDQREVGTDVTSFADGIDAALRSDPDYILIGELRRFESMRAALLAAETGVSVLATVHGGSAVEGIRRMFDAAPVEERAWAQSLLSSVLRGVIAQRFTPVSHRKGRALNVEVLVNTPAVAHSIRSGQLDQTVSQMQTGRSAGMLTFGQHLALLEHADTM